ncbi:MAG: hypothetical protein CMI55_03180 [Parcubacteria group bacterium]|jgi:hypothetical protein|nr:hypothetical protein [Parcubacteria group bacterium]|tara:strand:+ start:415 stop:687 length:273 start_codon:yes stop_codon:yes gene_type:complete
METLLQIRKLISSSNLKQQEQDELYNIIGYSPMNNLSIILELFKEDKKWVTWVYNNYKKKQNIFMGNKQADFSEILKEEKEFLDEIDKSI